MLAALPGGSQSGRRDPDRDLQRLTSTLVDLGLPKLETRFKTSLVEHLEALG